MIALSPAFGSRPPEGARVIFRQSSAMFVCFRRSSERCGSESNSSGGVKYRGEEMDAYIFSSWSFCDHFSIEKATGFFGEKWIPMEKAIGFLEE